MTPQPRYSKEEFAHRGDEIYEREVRPRVGPSDEGKFVVIDIDTGFDGTLTLPPALISTLGLVWHRRGRALLADGSESLFDIYEAIVIWDGEPRRIAVNEADIDPLVGMSLLYGYELIVQAIEGGTVSIQPLSQL